MPVNYRTSMLWAVCLSRLSDQAACCSSRVVRKCRIVTLRVRRVCCYLAAKLRVRSDVTFGAWCYGDPSGMRCMTAVRWAW